MDKKRINEILNNDGVIAFVTDTVWGVGCLPSSQKAVEKIYGLKHREAQKPLILMSNKLEHLSPYVRNISYNAKSLMQKHFPGALTVITEKSSLTEYFITSNKQTVGIRLPANKTFQSICEAIDGHVLATTSANLSGMPAGTSYNEVVESIGSFVDLVVEDCGAYANGTESTVVLAINDDIKILRQGAIELTI